MRNRILVVLCLLGSACSQDPALRKQAFLDSGNRYFAEGKYSHAIIEYRNAIQIDATLGEAHKRLAEAYARTGDAPHAFQEYVRAADLLPQDVDVQLTAGTSLLAVRRAEDALARAGKALELQPNNIQAHLLRGNALAGLSSFDEALQAIEEAIRLDPERGTSFTHLGVVELARGRRAEAETAFKRAVELAPKSVETHLGLANFYWSIGRSKETEQALAGALQAQPDHVMANRAMASFAIASGRYRDAEQYLVKIADSSKDTAAVLALADYYIAAGRAEDAVTRLEGIAGEKQLDVILVGQRLARAYAAAGKVDRAKALVEQVLANNPNAVDAQLLKGQLLLTEGRREDAFEAVKTAASANPSSAEAQFALGRMFASRGDIAAAEASFREVLRLNPRAGAAQVQLAKLQLTQGRSAESVRTADEAVKTQPSNLDARLTLVRSLLAAKDFVRADHGIAELSKMYPTAASVHALAGSLALSKSDIARARASFEKALANDPRSLDALAGLIALDFKTSNPAAAKARIARRLEQERTAELLVLAGRTYWTAKDADAAEKALRAALELNQSLLTPYAMLGQIYMAQKKLDQARSEFETLAAKQAKPVGALTMTGMILQAQGKNDLAIKRYEEVLAIDSRAAIAANNLAWMHAESGENLDVALQLAQTATAVVPDNPEIMDTLGWVYYKRQQAHLAIPFFERCVKHAPTNPSYHYHLGVAYLQSGDTERGRASLQRALAVGPNEAVAVDIRRALAETSAAGPKS